MVYGEKPVSGDMGLGDMILDIHRILTEEEPEGLRYMHRLR